MKEHDASIPVDGTDSENTLSEDHDENTSSTMDDEKKIEQEVLLTEQEDKINEEKTTWDGSESEFVEDDDAEDYEEKYVGIKLGYVLRKEEIFSCLKHVGFLKANGTRSIVEICLLMILGLMFFTLLFVTGNKINFILGVISILVIFPIIFMPHFFIGFNADKLTTGKRLSVEIFPDEIEVDSGSASWKIPLDGTSVFEEFNDMFLLYLPKEKLFIIPTRAIEPDLLADVQGMIIAGTTPKEQI